MTVEHLFYGGVYERANPTPTAERWVSAGQAQVWQTERPTFVDCSSKPIAAVFRVVAGERRAEFRQAQKLICRVLARDNKNVSIFHDVENFYWHTRGGYARRVILLHDENQRLFAENRALKRIVAKKAESSERPVEIPDAAVSKASQLLAIIGPSEAKYVFTLFETGVVKLSTIVRSLGRSEAFRLANLLGWAETAYVENEMLRSTRLGTAVGRAISRLTEEPKKS